MLVFKLILSCK